jgi:hypothetical protein
MRLTLLLFACGWACVAQDARSLVSRAVAADDHSDRLARNYIFKVRDEILDLDSKGGVKATHSTVDEVVYIAGKRYFRPLEKDGKPITPSEQRKQQERIDRAATEAGRLTEAERNKRIDDEDRDRAKRREQFQDVPDAYDFKLIREIVIAWRPAYEIHASPRAGYHGKFRKVLANVEGTVWIDKKDFNWVKVEADVLKPFSLGWFLARIGEGTHLSYEMMRVNDELWVPKDVSLKASARLGLVKKLDIEQNLTFSEYRKFQTDSRIVSSGEEP